MAVNRVNFGEETLIDLTQDTATPKDVRAGSTFHSADGQTVEGTLEVSGMYIGSGDMPDDCNVQFDPNGSTDRLPNPNALTFTGAVEAQYDGSEPLDIEIPVVPDKNPTPNKLTFTGSVTGSFDGSKSVNINIPEGGGYVVSSTSPTDTKKLWIDTSNGAVIKFYNPTSNAWQSVSAVWG